MSQFDNIKIKLLQKIKEESKPGFPINKYAASCLQDILDYVVKEAEKDPEESILKQMKENPGQISDGYHTFDELYYYRMLYNAAFFNTLPKRIVHKSKRHYTGEECFGGGMFIVMAELPTGQISNHYDLEYWDLFKIPEREIAAPWDGHTPQEAAERLRKYLETCKQTTKSIAE